MNQKNTRIINIAVISIALLSFVAFFFMQASDLKHNWYEDYKVDSKQPYGTSVVKNMLENHSKGQSFKTIKQHISKELPENPSEPASYVFIGNGYHLDSADIEQLVKFAANGNNVFISSKSIPADLMDYYLYENECNYNYWSGYKNFYDSTGYVNHDHPRLKTKEPYAFNYRQGRHIQSYRWSYISSRYFCEDVTDFTSIGKVNDKYTNFARVEYGKGNIYLHTTPLAFTNYHQVTEEGFDYTQKVFSHLPKGDIYWDAYSHVGVYDDDRDNRNNWRNPASLSDKTPLQYVLSQPSLKWAWYILLLMGGLFLAFRAKRRQRIIPIKDPNTNTSLEFIETIGSLYFQQNNHVQLSKQKMKLFLGFIRDRYHISTNVVDNKLIEKLVKISEVDKVRVEGIFKRYNSIKNQASINEDQLIFFHQAIDHFYKNCK